MKLRATRWFMGSLVLAGALAGGSLHAAAQEPADQDKTGEGATEKKQPLPDLNNTKVSSDPGKKMNGNGKAAQPEPGEANKALNKEADGKPDGKADDAGAKPAGGGGRGGRGGGAGGDAATPPEKIAYDYELPGADGKGVPLSTYKGKVLLIVNVARNSSYNTQLVGLEKLSEQYKDKGLIVIGVPSDEFGAAEPGTDPEIDKIYKVDDKVTFPIMAKSALTGNQELPFYQYLTKAKAVPENGPVHWNYTKFIVDKTGKVVIRLGPDVAPDSPEMQSMLEQVLSGRFKPRRAGGDRPGGGGGEDGPGN